MKTTNCLILSAAALLAGGLMIACQTRTETASNTTNQTTVSVAANSNQPTTAETKASPPTAVQTETDQNSVGSLATPTEAYKTAYAVRQKKDLAGLKRVLSKKMIGFFTEMGEAEHKSLDEELKDMTDTPQGATDESRNEKIDGNTATLEYRDAKGEWKTMDFVKEDGGWKLTFPPAGKPR